MWSARRRRCGCSHPAPDAARLAFTRIGDAGRRGLFRLGVSGVTGQPVFHFELPVDASGWSPPDYTASLVIKDRIAPGRRPSPARSAVHLRLRGLGPRQLLHVTLMEDDGTSWSAAMPVDSAWSEQQSLRSAASRSARRAACRRDFPGEWNYWVGTGGGPRRQAGTGRGSTMWSGCSYRCGAEKASASLLQLRRRSGVDRPALTVARALAGPYYSCMATPTSLILRGVIEVLRSCW